MNKYARALAIAAVAGATLAGTGCSVMRGQETAGAYVDDTAITTAVKAKFVEDKTVDASAIKVETLNGTVQLSGFAKSNAERAQAEYLARNTKGVRTVKNDLTVRP
jgi:hyperosmotically inducible periplasmic protein